MKKGLITSILMLTFGSVQAQPQPVLPRLVVMLTIDQLRTDYVEDFAPLYGEKGFRRLMREGKVFANAEMPFAGADRASALAALHTGSTPSVNVLAERLSASTTATGVLTSPRGTSAAASWNGTVLPYRVGTVPWNHDSDAVRPDLGRDAKIAGMNIAPPIVRLL